MPFVVCLIGGWGTVVFFSRKKFARLSQVFTVISIVLVGLNCTLIVKDFLQKSNKNGIVKSNPWTSPLKSNGSISGKPDVYFITLDEFDPAWFFDFLTQQGFHIIPKSRSNYFSTMNCLFSILNMDYIHYNPDFYGKYNVGSLFESMGYRFFNTMPQRTLSDAFYLKMNDGFIMELIHCSMLKSLGQEIQRFNILYIFNNFGRLIHEKGPKFIHIHIMCPHVPFVFDSTGARLPYAEKVNWRNKNIYLGQWIFVAKKMQSVVDSIFTQSPKPIIIIQSDHGVRSLPHGGQQPPLISDEKGIVFMDGDSARPFNYFQVSCNNISAFYFPDSNYADLYDSMTPVNTFRIVFNHFFNATFPLMPDESYNGPMVTSVTTLKDTANFQNVTRFTRW